MLWLLVVDFREPNQRFWRSVQENKLRVQIFFDRELFCFANQINFVAKVDDAVYVRQLFNDGGQSFRAEDRRAEESRKHDDQSEVNSDNSVCGWEAIISTVKNQESTPTLWPQTE